MTAVLRRRRDAEGKRTACPGQSLGPRRLAESPRVRHEGDTKDSLEGSFHFDEKTGRSSSLASGAVSFPGDLCFPRTPLEENVLGGPEGGVTLVPH